MALGFTMFNPTYDGREQELAPTTLEELTSNVTAISCNTSWSRSRR